MQAYDEYRGLMDDLSKADQFTYQVCEQRPSFLIESAIGIFCTCYCVLFTPLRN